MLTGARRDRVARTMPVTGDHGQQLRRHRDAPPEGHRVVETATGRISAVSATRGELTGRDALAIPTLAPSPAAGSPGGGLPRRCTGPVDGATSSRPPSRSRAVRDPGQGPPPGRPDSREACLWTVVIRSSCPGWSGAAR